jgi:hypothetical protein
VGLCLFAAGCGQKGGTDPLLGEFTFDIPIAYVKRPVDPLVTSDDVGNANPRNALQYKNGPNQDKAGDLYIREYASNSAQEYNITSSARGNFPGTAPEYDPTDGTLLREAGDVSDLDVSYDGKKIVFAFRRGDPPNTDADLQSKWDLWEYTFPTDADGNIVDMDQGTFNPVIPDNTQAQIGNDTDPAYLPDGSIVFTSDRVTTKAFNLRELTGSEITQEPLMDESNREPAVNLHIIIPGDSSSIKQISFNQSHELDPTVTSTGKIVYTRWDHATRGENASPFPLYQISPDGTGNDVLYGAHSFTNIDTGVAAYLQTREAQNGSLIATRMSRFGTYLGGDLVKIDYKNFVDIDTPRPGSSSKSTRGEVSLTSVTPLGGYASEGRFATPFPLWDDTNRILVAWAPCEVQDANGKRELCRLADNPTDTNKYSPAPPGFGIWMLQSDGVTMNPLVLPEDGWAVTDPVAIVDRITLGLYSNAGYPDSNVTPTACAQDQTLCDEEFGLVKIASVYDADNLSGQGQGRGLTSVRSPEMALQCFNDNGDRNTCTGPNATNPYTKVDLEALQNETPDQRPVRFMRVVGAPFVIDGTSSQNLRDILGYHVVEPDGSVVMRVPAGRPFSVELVDKNGHRFRSHPPNWLQVQPGEVLQCNGCHAGHTKTVPLNQGAVSASSFPGTDQNAPVPNTNETMAETLDRVSCDDADGAGDLVDGPTGLGCLYRRLSADLVFRDIWNDPLDTKMDNADFSVTYNSINNDLFGIPPSSSGGPLTINGVQIPVMLGGFASQANLTDAEQIDCIKANGGKWGKNCRIAINYETHIQTIWEKSRWMENPFNPGSGEMGNYPCVRCHREFDRDESLDNPVTVDVPDGQLNLTRTGMHQIVETNNNNDNAASQYDSYSELVRNDDVMVMVDPNDPTKLALVTIPVPDPNNLNATIPEQVPPNKCQLTDYKGNDIFTNVGNRRAKCSKRTDPDPWDPNNDVNYRAVLNFGGGRNYQYFYNELTEDRTGNDPSATGLVDHHNMLNAAELKMINEWLELGRRYWGDPFDQRDN